MFCVYTTLFSTDWLDIIWNYNLSCFPFFCQSKLDWFTWVVWRNDNILLINAAIPITTSYMYVYTCHVMLNTKTCIQLWSIELIKNLWDHATGCLLCKWGCDEMYLCSKFVRQCNSGVWANMPRSDRRQAGGAQRLVRAQNSWEYSVNLRDKVMLRL